MTDMDIECTPDSELIFDQRIVDAFQTPEGCCNISHMFDPDFARLLPRIAGRTPARPYFTAPSGRLLRIGWFVGFADEKSELAESLHPGIVDRKIDSRISNRSLPGIIDSTALDLFGGGERIFPFAALCDDGSECEPVSLRWQNHDFPVNDSLCFDTEANPYRIVLCDSSIAADAANEWEDGLVDDVRYDAFISPVAKSFADFASMLRAQP